MHWRDENTRHSKYRFNRLFKQIQTSNLHEKFNWTFKINCKRIQMYKIIRKLFFLTIQNLMALDMFKRN